MNSAKEMLKMAKALREAADSAEKLAEVMENKDSTEKEIEDATKDMDPGEFADKMEWDWPLVVEDVKSRATKTKQYIMKRKMMKERFNIDIQEV